MRPFSLGRLVDVVRLVRAYHGARVEDVEEALMVSRDRAVELLGQAEEMRLLRRDGELYYPTNLGNVFFEAYNSGDRAKLDDVLSGYKPYFAVKSIIAQKSVSVDELKVLTNLTEVAVEMILRLLQYTCDNLCFMGEKVFLSVKELPELLEFYSALRMVYFELSKSSQWGCSKSFIRVDKIAVSVCQELRLSMDDFSKMLDKLVGSNVPVDLHSEGMSYDFIPFADRRINPASYRRCYIRLRE
jgi:hypothetical protein